MPPAWDAALMHAPMRQLLLKTVNTVDGHASPALHVACSLVLLGATGIGASCGVFQLAWGQVYTRGGSGFAGKTVALSIALGALVDVLVMGLGTWFAVAFTAVLPLASSGLALFLVHEGSFPPPTRNVAGCAGHDALFGSHRTLGGLPVSLLAAFALFGLSFGYCQHNAVFSPGGLASYSSDALIAARGMTSLVIFVLLALLPGKFRRAASGGTHVQRLR